MSRDLNDRYVLSTSLAWRVLRFHIAKWIHKSFTSENILPFQNMGTISRREGDYLCDSTFLVRFQLARSSLAFSDPLVDQRPDWKYQVYIRPDRLGNNIYVRPWSCITRTWLITSSHRVKTLRESKSFQEFECTQSCIVLVQVSKNAEEFSQNIGSIYASVAHRRCLS